MTDAPPEILIRNARRFPGGASLSLHLRGGLIAALDPETAPPGARVIDARGAWALPAFFENHIHLFAGGTSLSQLNLVAVTDAAGLERALGAFRKGREGARLLQGYSANYEMLGPGTRPDRHALDRVLADQPLVIKAVDGHTVWANTAALELAGLMDHVPALDGAEVVIGGDGLPTGELREPAAMALVLALAPGGGREELGLSGEEPVAVTAADRAHDKATIRAALDACAGFGITYAVNMDGNLYQADLMTEMAEAGELPIRVSLPMRLVAEHDRTRVERLLDEAMRPPVGNLSFGRVKMFMDGVFDTWTAFRTDDYPGRPGFRGVPLYSPHRFAELCTLADARGLQIATHAVGDGAVRATIDGYEAAQRANGRRDARHRIEHLDMVHPDDLARMAERGILAAMQPVHPPGSSGLPLEPTISIMGRDRWADTFPWRAVKAAGIPLSFSADWPTAPLDPRNAIHSAMTRQPWAADMPDQRLPFEAVLAAYTADGAYPNFAEGRRGRLEPGLEADVMLIAGDPAGWAADPSACEVVMTLCAGCIVHDRIG